MTIRWTTSRPFWTAPARSTMLRDRSRTGTLRVVQSSTFEWLSQNAELLSLRHDQPQHDKEPSVFPQITQNVYALINKPGLDSAETQWSVTLWWSWVLCRGGSIWCDIYDQSLWVTVHNNTLLYISIELLTDYKKSNAQPYGDYLHMQPSMPL